MTQFDQNQLYASMVVFDELQVGPIKLEPSRLSVPYVLTQGDAQVQNELIYKYDEAVFEPENEADQNLASMMACQVALNYGLFCRKIVLHGLYDHTDQRVLRDWLENTAREIFVIKLLGDNPFITGDLRHIKPQKRKRYAQADLEFRALNHDGSPVGSVPTKWQLWDTEHDRFCVLSSGGKDSLLSLGLLDEMGFTTDPIFVNESGRHWYTALNAFRHLKEQREGTAKVWTNCDRMFAWFLRQMPFIRQDFANVRADIYPIRLWTVPVFLFGVLPLMRKRQIGNLIIGDEYDTTMRSSHHGIAHYSGLYDQSRFFDEAMSRYFMKKGWNLAQFSLLRSLSELLIETILCQRYPELQKHQISCHATHIEDGLAKPCGKCEKCRRIVGMLLAVDGDPRRCGYSESQIDTCLQALKSGHLHQEEAGSRHLNYLLEQKGILSGEQVAGKDKDSWAKVHPEVVSLRFDSERSPVNAIPLALREPLYRIFLEHAEGAVKRDRRKWVPFDLLSSQEMGTAYPFDRDQHSRMEDSDGVSSKSAYLWAELTWMEAEAHLEKMDVAILPVGAIEQHGPHLPLDVDSFDADYLARKVAEACADPKPLVLPLIPYGVSYHHDDFKGTISITNQAMASFVYDVGMGAARNGIKKLIMINGHGDNSPTLNFAAQMINRDAGILVVVDTGESSDVDLDDLCETENDVHAGEIETSTTMALRPNLVNTQLIKKGVLAFRSRYLNFSSLRNVPWYARTKLLSENGVMGDPSKATPEKGVKAWNIMVAHLVTLVEDLRNLDPESIHQKRY